MRENAAYSCPLLLSVSIFSSSRFVPETARWLFAHDKLDDAHAVLMKCALKTKVDPEVIRTMLKDVQKNEKEKAKTATKVTPLQLVKSAKLRRRTSIVCYNW